MGLTVPDSTNQLGTTELGTTPVPWPPPGTKLFLFRNPTTGAVKGVVAPEVYALTAATYRKLVAEGKAVLEDTAAFNFLGHANPEPA